jgi:hypothetical protein
MCALVTSLRLIWTFGRLVRPDTAARGHFVPLRIGQLQPEQSILSYRSFSGNDVDQLALVSWYVPQMQLLRFSILPCVLVYGSVQPAHKPAELPRFYNALHSGSSVAETVLQEITKATSDQLGGQIYCSVDRSLTMLSGFDSSMG